MHELVHVLINWLFPFQESELIWLYLNLMLRYSLILEYEVRFIVMTKMSGDHLVHLVGEGGCSEQMILAICHVDFVLTLIVFHSYHYIIWYLQICIFVVNNPSCPNFLCIMFLNWCLWLADIHLSGLLEWFQFESRQSLFCRCPPLDFVLYYSISIRKIKHPIYYTRNIERW